MAQKTALTVNILIREEEGLFVAHCLELDIVATADSLQQAKEDMISLIGAQISYAFSNNNLDYLYHPAPPEVWKEFYACRALLEEQEEYPLAVESEDDEGLEGFIPPWIIANTCKTEKACNV